ncbi:MAG: ArsC/Spx/MgsR family protein [Methylococcaceae bacterium]|jgi:nitrogenase-associated protein|nr:ArsC/Spx/MgsR family protein [Methylococcaceae bacterium]MDZ4156370.1 ArsC/Spx/MgsR family protein [Methylococcales bacterium]MDP2394631.1 ArsC/Spx/MgsR family protein [Methylococcaceae bacterium]MDP3019099.1 ArsC/Spx/MgsR family protein [Methylococcaceae bacterium]MDP3390315.1 ArsC/Spx/MgsR family protein [Methylococcaceae bacterium]
MATITFYEKPGCVNNTRQKKLLAAAGHQVLAKNLLTENWQPERLRAFFGDMAVRDWFNYSAPAIKHGEIDPEQLTEQQALALMLETPLLIRRPLMQVGDRLLAGFDQQVVDNWIGLTEIETTTDLESCPKSLAQTSCSHE